MKPRFIDVIGSAGTTIRVKPGESWPAPYRGSKYTIQTGRGFPLVGWKRNPLGVQANPFPDDLARNVRATKGGNGSFRITPHRAVITKVSVRGGSAWEPRYVGMYDDDLRFDGIENDPSTLQLGMYWTGLPFAHGESWKVSPRFRPNGFIHWSSKGHHHSSTRPYPELTSLCLDIRPNGGRIYFTESGCIWMHLPDSEVDEDYRVRFQDLQRTQLEAMKAAGLRATLRLLVERIQATGARPVYLGRIESFDHGEPPWTSFEVEPPVETHNAVDG